MDLSLTEEQELLRNTARDFMERECPKGDAAGVRRIRDGLLSRHLAEGVGDRLARYAGRGGVRRRRGVRLTDAAVVYEQLGAGPLSGPFFSSGALGALIVSEAGDDERKRRWLPNIASGREIVALALTEPEYGWGAESVQMRAHPTDSGYVLNGTKLFVHDAGGGHHSDMRRPARADARASTLLMVDARAPGLSTRLLPGFMGWVGGGRLRRRGGSPRRGSGRVGRRMAAAPGRASQGDSCTVRLQGGRERRRCST